MRRSVAALALSAVAMTACGSGPRTAPPPPAGVTIGGEATISLPRPASLDPGNVLDRSGEVVVRTMCDPLLEVDRETGEFVSTLLDSWVITDAGTRLVLRLRKGLTFWDGTPVTSRDAVFGLSRSASADFAGQNSWMLSGIMGFDVLQGLAEPLEARHRVEFSGIRILSDVAFEVTLKFTSTQVLPALTNPVSSPLSSRAAAEDPEAFDAMPVCIGPYRPTAPYDPAEDTFTLERVPTYPGVNEAFTGGGQGYLDRITFRWTDLPPLPEELDDVPDDGPGTGVVPQVAGPAFDDQDVVELDPRQRRRARAADDVAVISVPSPAVQYIGLPPGRFPVEARRALSQALDRRAIARRDLLGRGEPARGFLPRQLGSRLHRENACGDATPIVADVDLARRTLADAGLDLAGQSVDLVTNADFDNVALVRAIARQWERAFPGFNVNVVTESWDVFRRRFEPAGGMSDAFRTSMVMPFAGPDTWLRILWTGSVGYANAVAYSNPDFDELINLDAPEAIDPADQAVVHKQAEDLLCRDLPMIPVVSDLRHYAVADGLGSATGDLADLADPVTGGLRLRELYRP